MFDASYAYRWYEYGPIGLLIAVTVAWAICSVVYGKQKRDWSFLLGVLIPIAVTALVWGTVGRAHTSWRKTGQSIHQIEAEYPTITLTSLSVSDRVATFDYAPNVSCTANLVSSHGRRELRQDTLACTTPVHVTLNQIGK